MRSVNVPYSEPCPQHTSHHTSWSPTCDSQDVIVGKVACCQAWQPHGGGRKRNPHTDVAQDAPLTFRDEGFCSPGSEWDRCPGTGAGGRLWCRQGAREGLETGGNREGTGRRGAGPLWLAAPGARWSVRFKLGSALAPCFSAAARLVSVVCAAVPRIPPRGLARHTGPGPRASLRYGAGARPRAAGICRLQGGGAASGRPRVPGTLGAPARPGVR